MTIFEAAVLGLVQGLTEFLPISSSGHLVLAEHLLHLQPTGDLTFEVFVHFGTFMSVLVVFWKDIVEIVQSLYRAFVPWRVGRAYYRDHEPFRLSVCLLAGSVPAALVGLRYEDDIAQAFADPRLVAVMLVVTGLVLFLTGLAKPLPGKKVGFIAALLIGVAQAIAIVPGLSRSGLTISAALYQKVEPYHAARFSFLLSLPVIAGATLLKVKDLFVHGETSERVVPLLIGTLVSFVSGYVAIRFLLRILERGNVRWFSWYCLLVGVLGVILI